MVDLDLLTKVFSKILLQLALFIPILVAAALSSIILVCYLSDEDFLIWIEDALDIEPLERAWMHVQAGEGTEREVARLRRRTEVFIEFTRPVVRAMVAACVAKRMSVEEVLFWIAGVGFDV